MEPNDSTPQDAPVEPQAPAEPTAPETPTVPDEQPVESDTTEAQPEATESTIVDDEDYGYPNYQLPPQTGVDFSNLPSGDDGLIDPTALAGSINQQIALAEERASMRAQNAFQEQMAENRAWDKAFEKYPDLKGNKELRDMVQQTRIGQFSEQLNRNVDPKAIKLRTPMQVADSFFKHIGSAKAEGMKQATANTVVQQSAYTETAGRRGSDTGDTRAKQYQNLNNPNKEVAKKARTDLLRSMVFGED